ncbi:hypothetical protein [Filimonas effusa]|uniref:PepSY domain-containing protein n=1 Tax=Filimonas effusa TaxID=2508721 RepID=A0A4Q1D0I7_9BACT|nr:hypothetical protein [Filimonas effusa]RXK81254.1 hypothetical protein ESB13_20165 [Filimonas effusa]
MKRSALLRITLAAVICTAIAGMLFKTNFQDTIEDTLADKAGVAGNNTSAVPLQDQPAFSFDWTNEATLDSAEYALIKRLGVPKEAIRVLEDIHFYDDGRIRLEIQDPHNAEHLDEYYYEKGEWQQPKPVVTSIKDPWQERLFSLDKIAFRAVSRIAKTFRKKKQEIEGAADVTHIYLVNTRKGLLWYPRSFEGSRERYAVEFELTGQLRLFERE